MSTEAEDNVIELKPTVDTYKALCAEFGDLAIRQKHVTNRMREVESLIEVELAKKFPKTT